MTFEKQPPGTTFLYILDGPTSGGDTLFANMALAYRRLSPEFQKRLHGLRAVHSGIEQVNASLSKGGIARRDPITSEHPIVRTHPVTGEKALYVNPQCESTPPFNKMFRTNSNETVTRYIVGFKKEESDFLLKFLYDHIALSQDLQCRVRWRPGTVVVWDVSPLALSPGIYENMLTNIEPRYCPLGPVRLGRWPETPYCQNHTAGGGAVRDAF